MTEAMSRRFLGIGSTGTPRQLVARFEVLPLHENYYMTLAELCDWVEGQVNSGFYYQERAAIAVDREGLEALLVAQRAVTAGRQQVEDFPLVGGVEACFADFAITPRGTALFCRGSD